jgi:hypothetical protein
LECNISATGKWTIKIIEEEGKKREERRGEKKREKKRQTEAELIFILWDVRQIFL